MSPRASQGGRRGKGAKAGRERLAKRVDRPDPYRGDRSCETGVLFLLWTRNLHWIQSLAMYAAA